MNRRRYIRNLVNEVRRSFRDARRNLCNSRIQIDFGETGQRVVGIDLGTTNSLVAFMDLTQPRVIPGRRRRPAGAERRSLTRSGEIIVGNAARGR